MLIIPLSLFLLLLGSTAFVAALMISRNARVAVERRVDLVAAPSEGRPAAVSVVERLKRRSKGTNALVRSIFAVGMERRWGIRATALKLMLIAGGSAAAVWILASEALGLSLWLATPIALAASFLPPRFILLREQRKAERQFTDLFPDAVDTMVRMLRAGLPITAGMRYIGSSAPVPVSTVFAAIADQTQLGVPTEEALEAAGQRVGLADFRFFAVAVAMQRATGGNLAVTLESLADIIRKRRAMRLKAQSASAEIRVSAYVLGAMPILVVVGLFVLQPGYLAPLLTDPRGQVIFGVAAGMLLLGFGVMRQMMRGVTNA